MRGVKSLATKQSADGARLSGGGIGLRQNAQFVLGGEGSALGVGDDLRVSVVVGGRLGRDGFACRCTPVGLASLVLPPFSGRQNRGRSRRYSVVLHIDLLFSPCSVIMTGRTVSSMLARRGGLSLARGCALAWSLLSVPARPGVLTTHLQLPLRESRRLPERGSRFGDGLDYGVPAAVANSKVVIRVRLRSLVLPVRLGTASGLLRRPASAQLLLCSRTLPVLAPPFRSPQKSSFWTWEPRPLAFGCPRQTGRTGETYVPQ